MDRGFMEHYFEIAYNDVAGEIAGDDERYLELQKTADEAICSLTSIVGESNTALCKQCEHAINSLYKLTADVTINGEVQPKVSTTATCK